MNRSLRDHSAKVDVPDWLIAELTEFADGTKSWDLWENWLAMRAHDAAHCLEGSTFRTITANPRVEVIRFVVARGVCITPRFSPKLRVDPLEENEHFEAVLSEADRLARVEVGRAADEMGGCHLVWKAKKKILKHQFGLSWQSPTDLNDVFFD